MPAQEQEEEKPKKLFLNGYIKDLRTVSFDDGLDSIVLDNLIHNRINLEWVPNTTWDVALEIRNRIFYGEAVRLNPLYKEFIDTNDDYFDLSITPIEERSLIMHNMIDRAYVNWHKDKWEVRLGRQRINWGINTVWNPNDIFNAYSFFDFDYEERPGSDAIRIIYYSGFASGVEFAAKMADNIDEAVAAFLFKQNKWNYDFQLLTGIDKGDIAIGGGWAGNIKTAGFKGELAYFHPFEHISDTSGIFSLSMAVDYSFPNSTYFLASVLVNTSGTSESDIQNLLFYDISAKNLSPFLFTSFAQVMYPVTPIINSGLAVMYSPTGNAVFLNPSIAFSIGNNWSFDLLGQFFMGNYQDEYSALAKLLFARLKWSY